jgi:hypothetical protein
VYSLVKLADHRKHSYTIKTTWNNEKLDYVPARFGLSSLTINQTSFVEVEIVAPYFNNQKPNATVGEFFNLWDYEGERIVTLAYNSKISRSLS